jgi:hypothetical protein
VTLEELLAEKRAVIPLGEVQDLLDLPSRDALYRAAKNGQIPGVVQLGARKMVRTVVLRNWVQGAPAPEGEPA